jgi:hypothetical protein
MLPRAVGGASLFAALLGALGGSGCVHRPALCARTCVGAEACVAGECRRSGSPIPVESLDRFDAYQARRLVLPPVEVARLTPGEPAAAPPVATLGRASDAPSILLLRFSVQLPPGVTILEAHVLLERAAPDGEAPGPLALHAARIRTPWDTRSIDWGRAPLLDEGRYPSTTIDDPRRIVRVDVKGLVARWHRHEPDDQGIAIVTEGSTATGMAFALADGRGSGHDTATLHGQGPRLELYVK